MSVRTFDSDESAESDSLLIPVGTLSPEDRFTALADKWQEETGMLASPYRRMEHPSFRQIVGMGLTAVPLIFKHWETHEDDWFFALGPIVGESPAQGTTTYDAAKQKWLDWYAESSFKTCSFEPCQHYAKFHGQSQDYRNGCLVEGCVCATYSSPERKADSAKWFGTQRVEPSDRSIRSGATTPRQISVTVNDVADVIHRSKYGRGEHSLMNSCPCAHLAMFYLGITQDHGLYWPDGKGGNSWDGPTDTTQEVR